MEMQWLFRLGGSQPGWGRLQQLKESPRGLPRTRLKVFSFAVRIRATGAVSLIDRLRKTLVLRGSAARKVVIATNLTNHE